MIADFMSVVLDVDSTLCGIEGIDWLAERRDPAVGAAVAALTDRAMQGDIALDAVYGERLALVRPSREEVAELAEAYFDVLAPGAAHAIRELRGAGRRVVLVSGGLLEAIRPLASRLAVPLRDVHAVSAQFDSAGEFLGHDTASPLTRTDGKRSLVSSLKLARRVIAMGDGATDLAMRPAVDSFAAFTGFVRRDVAVDGADFSFDSFDQLVELVLA